jgi:putative ABC transport system permease protein
MLRNYFMTALRSLRKHKSVSAINIAGLAIGMTAFLVMLQYVVFELSYDNFHADRENIYRVESQFFKNGVMTDDWSTTSGGYGPAMQREFPSIRKFARIYLRSSERVVSHNDVKHREKNVFFADASMLEVFSFDLLKGSRERALAEPNTVILSESSARKYFGDADPIGKTLKFSNTEAVHECAVTGVFKDVPPNSHITFDMLLSWTTLPNWKAIDEFWYQHSAYTYVLLEPGTDLRGMERRFQDLAEKYKTREALKDHTWGISLVPLKDIHLNPAKANEREVKGSRTTTSILSAVAILSLLIAWINYINLATTRALERAREIGIRKTAGANKGMLISQFLLESTLVNFIGLTLAIGITWLVHPYFQTLTNTGMFHFSSYHWTLHLALLGIFIMGILFSGLYPALVLSSFNPITALKGKIVRHGRGKSVRQSLVVFQFIVSMVLITVAVVVYQQVQYMRNRSLGQNTDQILVLKIPSLTDHYGEKIDGLREALLKLSAVSHVTFSSAVAGKEVGMNLSNRRADVNTDDNRLYEMLRTDHAFIETYQLELLYGRNFSRDVQSDENAVIVNEEAVKLLGYKDNQEALHKEVFLEASNQKFTIIGVAKNYHHTSLRDRFAPIMLFISPRYRWIPYSYISLKVKSSDWNGTIAAVKAQWDGHFPESSFDYFFLNEFIDQQYRSDVAFGKLVNIFCAWIIGIACLGLLGLASYDTILRRKEVGVRKVLGASISSLLLLLSKDLFRLLAIAYGVALPLAYIMCSTWLTSYSFHTELAPWMLMLPLIILLPVAFITVSSQTLKAARSNPVESLRE